MWALGYILPNVDIREPVETDAACLVSCHAKSVQSLGVEHPSLLAFLSKFTNPFGNKLSPGVLLVRADERPSRDEVVSFRNLIAMSVVPLACAESLIYRNGRRPTWSDYFEVYPWNLDRDYKWLVGETPAFLGVHVVDQFVGQSSPAVSPVIIDRTCYDTTLLRALLKLWERRYGGSEPTWEDRAICRSIDMAFAASKTPAGLDTTMFSWGRSLGLWVSAFETLVHDGKRADSPRVYDLLRRVPWMTDKLKVLNYALPKGEKGNLACRIYNQIYDARNAFFHGNEVTVERLYAESGQSLVRFAAPLFRMALAAIVKLQREPDPSLEFDREHFDFCHDQRNFENALAKILDPVEDD